MRKVIAGLVTVLISLVLAVSLASELLSSEVDQASANCTSTTPGVLPGVVPEPYNSIFTAASAQWKIDPALLAAIFESEQGNTWPNANGPWATSGAGAGGPFQFEPGTWVGYGSSNPQHPAGDIQDLTDAAYAAAHYLQYLGGSLNMAPGNPNSPTPGTVAWVAGSYNGGKPLVGNGQNDQYRANAVNKFLEFKGSPFTGQVATQPTLVGGNPAVSAITPGCPSSDGNILLSANGYTSPFPVRPIITRAIDQGVDYSVPVGTPLRAIGTAQIKGVQSGWYNGQPFMWYKLLDGSLAGKCVYYAEQLTGTAGVAAADPSATSSLRSEIGSTVAAGHPIAFFATAGSSLEFGFADCTTGATLAALTGGYVENSSTAAGVSFNKLMAAVGVPSDSPYPSIIGSAATLAGLGYP